MFLSDHDHSCTVYCIGWQISESYRLLFSGSSKMNWLFRQNPRQLILIGLWQGQVWQVFAKEDNLKNKPIKWDSTMTLTGTGVCQPLDFCFTRTPSTPTPFDHTSSSCNQYSMMLSLIKQPTQKNTESTPSSGCLKAMMNSSPVQCNCWCEMSSEG
jgi:hypothetical protein